jgi:carbonic anhydrase
VVEQINNLAKNTTIQHFWRKYHQPQLHGWVYDLHDGLLNNLLTINPTDPIDPIYHYEAKYEVEHEEPISPTRKSSK